MLPSGSPGPGRRGTTATGTFIARLFSRSFPPLGGLTLDVGCGEGRLTRDLARLRHGVVGIDASPAMVAAAAAHPGTAGWFAPGDAAALPVADGAADCVVAFMSLQDVDDMEDAVAPDPDVPPHPRPAPVSQRLGRSVA